MPACNKTEEPSPCLSLVFGEIYLEKVEGAYGGDSGEPLYVSYIKGEDGEGIPFLLKQKAVEVSGINFYISVAVDPETGKEITVQGKQIYFSGENPISIDDFVNRVSSMQKKLSGTYENMSQFSDAVTLGTLLAGGQVLSSYYEDAVGQAVIMAVVGGVTIKYVVKAKINKLFQVTEKIIIDDAQFGKKVGKHAADFGLDPSNAESRSFIKDKIKNVFTRMCSH